LFESEDVTRGISYPSPIPCGYSGCDFVAEKTGELDDHWDQSHADSAQALRGAIAEKQLDTIFACVPKMVIKTIYDKIKDVVDEIADIYKINGLLKGEDGEEASDAEPTDSD
jgi:hypothetical protein